MTRRIGTPDHEHSQDGDGGAAINPVELGFRPKETENNIQDRDVVSTERIELHIDPNGDDSAEGTSTDPIATLQEAFHRLPHIIQHEVEVNLPNGTADTSGAQTGVCIVNFIKQSGNHDEPIKFIGDTATPSNADISGRVDMAFLGGAPHRVKFEGIQFQKASLYRMGVTFDTCRFVSDSTYADSGGISGYNFAAWAKNCTFTGDCDYVSDMSFFARLILEDVSGSVNTSLIRSYKNAQVTLLGNNTLSYPTYANNHARQAEIRSEGGHLVRNGDTWYAENDAHLDRILASVNPGDTVLLGNATFSKARTGTDSLPNNVTYRGTGYHTNGTEITGAWEIQSQGAYLENLTINDVELKVSQFSNVEGIHMIGSTGSQQLTVTGDGTLIRGVRTGSGAVVFQTGTSGGLADGIIGTVTDNGTNTIGTTG